MVGHLMNTFMQDMEIALQVDPSAERAVLKVSDEQEMEVSQRGDRGYTLRVLLGKPDEGRDLEAFYEKLLVGALFTDEEGGNIPSLDGIDRVFLTFSRDEEEGYGQFKEDIEVFLNYVDMWTVQVEKATEAT